MRCNPIVKLDTIEDVLVMRRVETFMGDRLALLAALTLSTTPLPWKHQWQWAGFGNVNMLDFDMQSAAGVGRTVDSMVAAAAELITAS